MPKYVQCGSRGDSRVYGFLVVNHHHLVTAPIDPLRSIQVLVLVTGIHYCPLNARQLMAGQVLDNRRITLATCSTVDRGYVESNAIII